MIEEGTARDLVAALQELARPSIVYRPQIERVCDTWSVAYAGIRAHGDTPAKACAAFDRAWHAPLDADLLQPRATTAAGGTDGVGSAGGNGTGAGVGARRVFDIPADAVRDNCRSCGEPLAFVVMPSGKKNPIETRTRESHFARCPDAARYRKTSR